MQPIKIKQIKKAYLRNYTLSFDKDLTLIVKTPVFYTSKHVEEVVSKHKDWIEKNYNLLESKQLEAKKHSKEIRQGEIFEILEEEYVLKFKFTNRQRVTSYLEENYLVCEIPLTLKAKIYIGNIEAEQEVKESLIKLFKKIAETYIYSKARDIVKIYKTSFNDISVKDQSTKWGSCSSKRNLNFNWRLIFTPYKIIDYVVIHEICHLREMNHSKSFWNLVLIQSPNYKLHRKWLKDNQDILKNLI